MSANQSRRAEGRIRDLRGAVIERLEGHAPLTDHLEAVDSIDAGRRVIMPAAAVDIQHRADNAEPPAAAIAVMAVTGSSDRENRQERKNHVVQCDFQVRSQTLRALGSPWNDDVLDEVAAVVTSHRDPFVARGVTGGSPDPAWDGQINRYRSVQRFDVEHWG